MTTPADTPVDVLILGGGLAGLTLALQLRDRCPDLSIRVLERRSGPAPAAAFKVGESLVEVGAHYLANTLGLRAHLDGEHIRKFGFRFFFSDGEAELDHATELGISRVFPTPTWQLERGTLENFLAGEAARRCIDLQMGATVHAIEPGSPHVVQARHGDVVRSHSARWLVDAAGRAGLLRRRLQLDEDNGHAIGAAWFRTATRLRVDDWCADATWRERCEPQERWRSTNHLCGPGYWVWLIPLASGAHSVGIVADPARHPLETFNTFERASAWLRIHQPALARALDAQAQAPLDFGFLRHVSYGCRQVFSAERWALTGEAGLFLDPFYSPGTDFIAIANGYITELIARDAGGGTLAALTWHYQRLFFSFYRNTLALYRGQYDLFGNARAMSAKVLWDYAYYWGVLAPLMIGGWQTDLALFAELEVDLIGTEALNLRMQALFRDWHAQARAVAMPRWLDQRGLEWFVDLNARLHERHDAAGIRARLRESFDLLHRLAAAITAAARRDVPGLDPGATTAIDAANVLPRLFERAA